MEVLLCLLGFQLQLLVSQCLVLYSPHRQIVQNLQEDIINYLEGGGKVQWKCKKPLKHWLINHPINQLISQPIHQFSNQSHNQSLTKPIKHPANDANHKNSHH